VAEAIHCPSCTTRYRLRPERLKPVIRRAKCFSCGSVFPVGDVVQRLLAPPAPDTTVGLMPDLVAAAQHEVPHPVVAPEPTLNLADLGDADSEILEKTLVTVPDTLPEAKVEATSPYPPEITETTLSGYSSARDAIEKLFGGTPLTSAPLKVSREPSAMDMEATMSALENTLGASPAAATSPVHVGSATPAPELSEEDLAGPSSSTLRLSQQDLLAAIAAAPSPAPALAPAPAEPTVPLRAADLLASQEERSQAAPRPVAPRPSAPFPETPEPGAEMLRLKIGEDIYGGLTMPQLISWVEEGRILENHLVARQHSENWLEAHKVPGLRPVFERLRRERSSGAPSLDPGPVEPAPKKSLFGGLFGKS
jgi:predicted Zn finger-like uncharacterized protein